MQEAKITPKRLAETVIRLAPTLQEILTPEEWAELNTQAQGILDAEDDQARRLAGITLINWLDAHKSVHERVDLELTLTEDLRKELRAALVEKAQRLGLPEVDPDPYVEAILRGVRPEVAPSSDAATRQIFLTPDRAIRVSLRNVWLHPGELLEFLASAAFTAKDVSSQPSGVLLGFGVLWLVRSLYNLTTEEITDVDAIVLWATWHACGRPGGQAPLHRILDETQKAASRAGIPLVDEQTVVRCLQRLVQRGIIDATSDGEWILRERCRVNPLA